MFFLESFTLAFPYTVDWARLHSLICYKLQALKQAGLNTSSVSVGVGIASAEYNNHIVARSTSGVSAYSATGGAPSVASGRISYTFGFKGPALSIDTACSSSLVATHVAVGAIWSCVSTAALAAGVGLLLNPEPTAMFQKAGMLSPDGRCKTLDADADGYVRGEAIGVLYFSDITATDGLESDVIATLTGTSVNQDGRSSSLTAPNGPAQQEAIRAALRFARESPTNVTHLQLHGTGTPLGDPIELGAAHAVLATSRSIPVSASTAKGWIGHTEAGAGVMGISQATFGASFMYSLGISHLRSVNAHIIPVMNSKAAKDGCASWHLPRESSGAVMHDKVTAGVSSFAFQGTNAHAILQGGTMASLRSSQLKIWRNQRIWVAPPSYSMIYQAITSRISRARPQAVFDCLLKRPCMAFMRQHKIKEASVLPAAAFLEISSCGVSSLRNLAVDMDVGIVHSVFTTPAVLADINNPTHLLCNISVATGSIEVGTVLKESDRHRQRQHFYAGFTLLTTSKPAANSTDIRGLVKASMLLPDIGETFGTSMAHIANSTRQDDSLVCNPATVEASVHLNAAHPSYSSETLRVAAKIESCIHTTLREDTDLWACSIAMESGRINSHRLLGNAGGKSLLHHVETRRLIIERPTVLHPRYDNCFYILLFLVTYSESLL